VIAICVGNPDCCSVAWDTTCTVLALLTCNC
jgi:hypothetical protein